MPLDPARRARSSPPTRLRRTRPAAAAAVAATTAAATALLCALSSPAVAAAPAASAPTGRVPLAVPAASAPAGAADDGAAPAGTVSVRVYLSPRDPAGLRRLARQVATPGNPRYRHFLTPAQYAAEFAPTAAQRAAVAAWLHRCGLTVSSGDAHAVAASGDPAAIRCAVGAPLHRYTYRGAALLAPAGPLTVPRDVAPDVLAITGLGTPRPAVRPASTQPAPVSPAATASCSAYFGAASATSLPAAYGTTQPWQTCGYLPSQLRSAYGVTGTALTGAGTTVAVVGAYASATTASDIQTYAARHGEQAWAAGQYTEQVPAGLPAQPASWGMEETMDVEAVHAMAPAADVVYVAAADSQDSSFVDALSRIVDAHLADVVSDSWVIGADSGVPAATEAAFQQDFLQGAVEGIGFVFASGDTGSQAASADGSGPAVTAPEYPAADPWVTAVGGTSLAVGSDGQYQWETGWETDYAQLTADGTGWQDLPGSYAGGSGGGVSTVFPRPFYQSAVHPAGTDGTGRAVPDVAMDADPVTGMRVGQTFSFGTTSVYVEYASGGSSLAAPLFAGVQALAQQRAGRPLGFADPAIYAAAARGAFRDVTDQPAGTAGPLAAVHAVQTVSSTGQLSTSYVLATFGRSQDAGLVSAPGYDDVTGLGSPAAGWLDDPAGTPAGTAARRP